MKLGINLSNINLKSMSGIPQYSVNLIQGFEKIGVSQNIVLFIDEDQRDQAENYFKKTKKVYLHTSKLVKKTYIKKTEYLQHLHYKDRMLLTKTVKKENIDMIFHPFNSISINAKWDIPSIVTIHDLFYKNFPEGVNKYLRKYVNRRHKKMTKQIDHIIVPSEFVKQDIIKHFPYAKDKIKRIYNPITGLEAVEEFKTEKPYILSINSIALHKNIITLLKAFELIRDKIDYNLILVGKGYGIGFRKFEQYIKDMNNLSNIILTGYISNEQRNHLYKNADLFITPSLHEGFGMTPIEAMIYETPVISTKCTSLYEVTSGLANYYEPPTDEKALANKILEVLSNPETKEELARKSLIVKEKYNDEKIAKEYWDYFREGSRDGSFCLF